MEEQLIEYKTALLAKEKGFNIHRNKYYYDDLKEKSMSMIYDYKNPNHYCCPTQALLQKWLRDNHNIHIFIKLKSENNYEYYCYKQIDSYLKDNGFKTYEEALEIALQKALESI